jgi:four helix bundle protein
LNIAEGASRRGVKDFRKHLDIARASLHEIEAILDLVLALDYFHPDELAELHATRDECAKMVYGLLRKLPDGPKQPGR